MNKCLVTKLKVAVNNPNLPVFETMQQFTLDAITASGNSSMTDEQKYALNHFFYQIGAIANNGIYAKMAYIGLPMIAGDVAGALNNYVGNVAYTLSDNRVVLSNHCIKASVNGNVSLGYNTLPKTLTVKTNMSAFVGIKDSGDIFSPFDTKDANAQRTQFQLRDNIFNVNNVPYVSQSTAKTYSADSLNKGIVLTAGTGSGDKGYYFDRADNVVKMKSVTTKENLMSEPTALFQITAPRSSYASGAYYLFVGEALTENEINILLNEAISLRSAFLVE